MSASSCRASPPTSSPASSAATRARPRRASNISCSARSPRHPALRHLLALRLHRHDPVRRHRRRARPTASRPANCSASSSSSPASPSRSARCRSTCGRPTSTKARRRRSPPSSPPRPRSRPWRCWPGSRSRRWARRPIRMAPDRHLHGSGLDRPRRRRRDRPAATSSGCSPTARSTMSASLWSASPPARRAGVASVLFYMAVYVVMTLGAFLVVLQDARRGRSAGRDHRQPRRPVAHPADARAGHGDVHVQPRRHPASVRLLAQVPGVRRGGRGEPHLARRGRRSRPR